ncbi:uracil phosphoribosyltransferase [Aeropyrum pernix]|uniref:Uracil phosphoribosyltransferase n=1 Tax=Aeropyrum pernix TaxID=56636 RepID=A0A401HAI7_AERPX|nr:uracil phosphoribosyltransferase [Aeropyrum pernix]GBF09404.1 uracil phosphoribosyltransferase [Aeropyrum pernix]
MAILEFNPLKLRSLNHYLEVPMVAAVRVIGGETPLARYVLRVLRDRTTGFPEFRRYVRIAGSILAVYIAGELGWVEEEVETPLGAKAKELAPAGPVYLVGILGASLPMVEGFASMMPEARIALVAARRVEEPGRLKIEVYYSRLPRRFDGPAVVLDPMLATGKTVAEAVRLARDRGASKVVIGSIIASRQGVEYISSLYGDTPIYTLALDPELDENYFIVPGLGDAGDRALGVEP